MHNFFPNKSLFRFTPIASAGHVQGWESQQDWQAQQAYQPQSQSWQQPQSQSWQQPQSWQGQQPETWQGQSQSWKGYHQQQEGSTRPQPAEQAKKPEPAKVQAAKVQAAKSQPGKGQKAASFFSGKGKLFFFMVLAFMDLFFVHFVLAFQVDFWPLFQIGLVTTLEDKHKAARRTTGSGQRPSLHQRLHLKMRAGRSQEAEGGRGVPGQHLLPAAEA